MDNADIEISSALIRLQAALAGVDMQTALNALSVQLGVLAVLGADDKGQALAVVRDVTKQARETVSTNWGRPDLGLMRRQMRGETVQ